MSEIKEILKDLKPKYFDKYSKDDRTYIIYDNANDLVNFYIKKGYKSQNLVDELFDRMENPKFAKAAFRISKTQEETPLPLGMATVIADFLERRHEKLDEEIIERYMKTIDNILAKRVKKISKKLDLNQDLVKELLVVVSEPDAISNPNYMGIYVNRILRKLYTLSKDNDLGLNDVKTIKKLFKQIFGKESINNVAVNVLLERKDNIRNFNESQKALWNLMTNFALDVLESNKKKDLKEVIKYYVSRRKKDAKKERDSARRIQFAQIAEEDYPKLHAVAKKLAKEEENRNFL